MSRDDREAEDVAGLFRKFGGDAKSYKEFESVPELGQPRPAWTLIPGSPGAPPAAVPAPGAADPELPTAAPAPMPPAPAPGAPRQLDLPVARLAGQPPPGPEGGHGFMSRWRKRT